MKKSSKHVWKASWRRLEDVLEDEVLLLQRRLQGVSKTSWKTKNVWWVRRIYYFVIKKYFLKEKFFQKVFLFKKILFLLHVIINILTRHWKNNEKSKNDFVNNVLSRYLCDYRKDNTTGIASTYWKRKEEFRWKGLCQSKYHQSKKSTSCVNPYKTMYFAITAIKQAVACGMFYLAYWLKGKVCNLTKTLSPYSN